MALSWLSEVYSAYLQYRNRPSVKKNNEVRNSSYLPVYQAFFNIRG